MHVRNRQYCHSWVPPGSHSTRLWVQLKPTTPCTRTCATQGPTTNAVSSFGLQPSSRAQSAPSHRFGGRFRLDHEAGESRFAGGTDISPNSPSRYGNPGPGAAPALRSRGTLPTTLTTDAVRHKPRQLLPGKQLSQ
jgi:hypothetical protein